MKTLHLHCRWTPWWVVLIAGALSAPILYGLGTALLVSHEREPGERIMIPVFTLLTYLFLGLIFNRQTAKITPAALRARLLPFPFGNGHSVQREDITHLYIRRLRVKESSVQVEVIHSVGIATRRGVAIDLQSAFNNAQAATQTAHEILNVLNSDATRRPLDLFHDQTTPAIGTFKRTAFLWLALFVAAVLIGAAWEL